MKLTRSEINMLTNMNDSREQQLEELKSFIDTVNEEVANIVSTLGWTEESVKNVNKEYFKCPYDSSHWLTEACFNDHLASCQLKAEGYGKLDVWLSEPTLPTDSPFCIKFDKQLQAQVFRVAKEQNPAMQIAGCECYILGAESIYPFTYPLFNIS